jgi:hypothetical protein
MTAQSVGLLQGAKTPRTTGDRGGAVTDVDARGQANADLDLSPWLCVVSRGEGVYFRCVEYDAFFRVDWKDTEIFIQGK